MAESKSMIDAIRQRINQSSAGGRGFFRLKAGDKRRVRFLSEMDEAVKVIYHDKWGGISTPCLKYFNKKCPYCEAEGYRTRDHFVWSIYDYEAKEQMLMMSAAHDKTVVPHLLAAFDQYGSICSRDFVIQRKGKGFDTSYTLMPLDKEKFKGASKFKALTEDEIFEKLKSKAATEEVKAPAAEDVDEEFEDEDDEKDIKDMDLDELIEYADDNDIDLSDLSKKERKNEKAVRKAIKEALEKKDEDEDDEDEDDDEDKDVEDDDDIFEEEDEDEEEEEKPAKKTAGKKRRK